MDSSNIYTDIPASYRETAICRDSSAYQKTAKQDVNPQYRNSLSFLYVQTIVYCITLNHYV
jgi:hypothetical protein